MTRKTYNVLSIDGGGLRGIVPLRILQKIEELAGKKIHECFDMISGTSTGGIIACCLSLKGTDLTLPKYSVDDITNLYINDGAVIFPIESSVGKILDGVTELYRPRFNANGLDQVLKKYLDGEMLADSLMPILVSTYDLQSNRPVFFKTNDAKTNSNLNPLIHDVCRATSAAPTYLPPYSFTYNSATLTGIDGGVFINNPTMAALAELSRYGQNWYSKIDGTPVAFGDIRVLSLGTGSFTGKINDTEVVKWGEMQWISKITDIMMKGVNQTTDYEAYEMLDTSTNPNRYLRLSIDINDRQYSDMADARVATRNYLDEQVKSQITENPEVVSGLKVFIDGICKFRASENTYC